MDALPLLLYLMRLERNSAEFADMAHTAMMEEIYKNKESSKAGSSSCEKNTIKTGRKPVKPGAGHAAVNGYLKLKAGKILIAVTATLMIGTGAAIFIRNLNEIPVFQNVQKEFQETSEEKSESEAMTERKEETETQAETETEIETQTEIKTETETETETLAETEIGTETRGETETETGTETQGETETETKIETQVVTENEIESEFVLKIDNGSIFIIKSENKNTSEQDEKELAEGEYPSFIEGGLTKEELEFVFAYGPQEIPKGGFHNLNYREVLNQLCQGSQNLEAKEGKGYIKYLE